MLGQRHNRFVGRVHEADALAAAFARGQVVTLVGAGGIGKTRLAATYAATRPPPMVAIDCTEARDAGAVARLAAAALELTLPIEPAAGIEQVGHALAGRQVGLLWADNFDWVIPVVGETLGRLRALAPRCAVLITARSPTALPGEQVMRLEPLAIDDGVQLLEARVTERFGPGAWAPDRAAARRLVERLDGFPLSLELAAGRLGLLTIAELERSLDAHRGVLRSPHAAIPRHVDLMACVGWTWALLPREQQLALARLSVLAGGFDMSAAAAVIGGGGAAPLDIVSDLRDRALLRVDSRAGVHELSLPDSVREFAARELDAAGARAEAERAQLTHFLALAEAAAQARDLAARDAMLANLLAAHGHALRHDVAAAARLVLALEAPLCRRGSFAPFLQLIDASFAALADGPRELRGQLHLARAAVRRFTGPFDAALADLAAAEQLIDSAGATAARLHQIASWVHIARAAWPEVMAAAARARELHRALGDRFGEGLALVHTGAAHAGLGELTAARRSYEEAIAIARPCGDRNTEGTALVNLGNIESELGDQARAIAHKTRAVELARELGDRRGEGQRLTNLANSVLDSDPAAAEALYLRALAINREMGNRVAEVYALANLGIRALLAADPEGASARFDETLRLSRELSIQSVSALIHAYRAAACALRDLVPAAEADLAAAAREPGPPQLPEVIGLVAALCDVARARARGPAEAHTLLAGARARLESSASGGSSDVRNLRRVLDRALREQPVQATVIVVSRDGRQVAIAGGPPHDLGRRRSLRLILLRLIEQHASGARAGLGVEELFAAGWPGQRAHPDSVGTRVYNAVRLLRKLGLGPALLTRDDGYLLDPAAIVKVEQD